ncbi:MAG: hypothetical protein K2I00_10310 [Ruminococcus sp.]|nr:hypothetical protein [Ruminococcus sp.]
MAKTIKDRFQKWKHNEQTFSDEYLKVVAIFWDNTARTSIFDIVRAITAEQEKAFEAGYMTALKHVGGKKK